MFRLIEPSSGQNYSTGTFSECVRTHWMYQYYGSGLMMAQWPETCRRIFNYLYTGCSRRNGQNLGRVFLMLKYTDITQNTYIQSWTVTDIMAIEKCGLLGGSTFCTPSVTPYSSTAHARQQDIVMQWPWRMLYSTVSLTSQDNGQLRPA